MLPVKTSNNTKGSQLVNTGPPDTAPQPQSIPTSHFSTQAHLKKNLLGDPLPRIASDHLYTPLYRFLPTVNF